MEVDRIELFANVLRMESEASPSRCLVFHLELSVRAGLEVCILSSWVKLHLGIHSVAQGPLLHLLSALIHPTTIGAEHRVSVYVRAPITAEALELVEQNRNGGDLPYRMDFDLVAMPVRRDEEFGTARLEVPQRVLVKGREGHSCIEGKVPQSEWLSLLRQMNWCETRLIELPLSSVESSFPHAYRYFSQAQDHYRRGDWKETLASCRLVTEAVAGARGGYREDGVDIKKLRDTFDEGVKGDRLNDMAKEFGGFLHLARHDSPVQISRSDATLALHITSALLAHWSRTKP